MTEIEVTSPEPVYAGFWLRFLAFVVDTLLLLVIIIPAVLAIYGLEYPMLVKDGGFAGPADFLLQVVVPAVAVIVFWRARGATPGKMLIGAKIVDAETLGPPSTGRLIARYLGYIPSTLVVFLGFIWIAFDKRKQAWHDKIGRTVVVRPNKG